MEKNHALATAESWHKDIADKVLALDLDWDRLEELTDERADLCAALIDAENDVKAYPGDASFEDELRIARAALFEWNEDNAQELADLKEAAGDYTDADDVRSRILEDALSVEVRADWRTPGSEDMKPTDFRVLLTTGGPAVQLRGELDEYGEPTRAWLEYQDWGNSWTQYFGPHQETLLAYARAFYFGE
jgi:hypothetical protein